MLSWYQREETASTDVDVARELLKERAWVEVDLNALIHNVQQLRGLLSANTELMAVVKADAYGHGAVTVARTILQQGVNWLGVATIPEGIELREAGIQAPILVLGATNTPEQVRAIAQWQLQPTLCTPKQALIFSETLSHLNQTLSVHLKLDTGMSRLGTPWEDAAAFLQLVHRLPGLKIASVYSHLATADNLDSTLMHQQQQRFQQAIAQLQTSGIPLPPLHLSNSAATLSDSSLHYDLVRVGLAIYGLYPAPHLRSVVNLKPAMQVKARVTQVKTIPAGAGVSYGHHYTAEREMQIAVVGIGYADGVPRSLSNKISVLIQGKQIPQIGAITMDQLMVDITQVPHIQEGDVVTLLGEDGGHCISADDWANILGTIAWEILCSFKHRLPRLAVGQLQEFPQPAIQA
jgi:alanine racemase